MKPKAIKGAAAKIWEQYAPLLHWLSECDSEALAAWCSVTAEFHRDPEGMDSARLAQMRILAAELGMTPGGRARLATGKSDPKKKSGYFT